MCVLSPISSAKCLRMPYSPILDCFCLVRSMSGMQFSAQLELLRASYQEQLWLSVPVGSFGTCMCSANALAVIVKKSVHV
mmetsp:Transcript_10969/g.22558  ORF Transcript_10969/g.22558 Transcript_10969/m.22558 type:complete len:80 (+) Transcript_10969:956-1195(+)